MIRNIATSFLLFCALSTAAQDRVIPDSLKVPNGTSLITHVYAKGVQQYVCSQDSKDTTRYSWVFIAPKADLYSDTDYHKLVGKHYLNAGKKPTWKMKDGSTISGLKLKSVKASDSLSVPWLLLKGITPEGTGQAKEVTYIQRINTRGGNSPLITGTPPRNGQLLEVPYTAEYLFYK
ncbi:DUF3455 domain-containing protein [Pedobacter sp. L105]|uniref:DUF3455 domain-containing protein n=1 Tax=Pedobacter sp. L105 TaxID=1641871 RepID=UPI00131C6552|nr:DUF3455 domain-containing protein [Pedobacter sp. L105]